MNLIQLRRFFKKLSEEMNRPVKIYLTGGMAAMFYGGVRPTEDIDFAISESNTEIIQSLETLSVQLEVPIQYSSDIQRWGMINIPDYEQEAVFVFKEGELNVYALAPEKWAVGKLTRFFQDDLLDLVKVMSQQKPDLDLCLQYWQRALDESPASQEKVFFKKNVQYFLDQFSQEIWGKNKVIF